MEVETNGNQAESNKIVKHVKSVDKEIEVKILQIVNNLVAEREKTVRNHQALTDKADSLDRQLNVANAVSERYKKLLKNLNQRNVTLEAKNRSLEKKIKHLEYELDYYVKLFKESQENGIPLSQVKPRAFKEPDALEGPEQNRSKSDDDILVIDEENNDRVMSPQY